MATITQIHKEIRGDQKKNAFLLSSLNASIVAVIVIGLTTLLPSTFLTLQTHVAIIAVFFILSLIISYPFYVRNISVSQAESKVSDLSEIYSTTIEFANVDTEPAKALREEFSAKAQNASTITLLDINVYQKKILVLFVLIGLLVFIPTVTNLEIDADQLRDIADRLFPDRSTVDPDQIQLRQNANIFGDPTIITSGDESLQIRIDLSTGGGDFQNPSAWENTLRDSSRDYWGINAQIDTPAIEQLPAEFDLAKSYNLKIRQTQN